MKPFLSLPGPWLVAHRGGAALAPENTLAAFDRGVALGADCLELDVRRTRDGEVVVFHDRDTSRIAGVPGRVEERSFAELVGLDAGQAFTPDGGATFPFRGRGLGIPRLSDLLERHPAIRLHIDAKGAEPELAEALVRVLRSVDAIHRVCIGSTLDRQGERLRSLLPEACHFLPTGAARRHVLAAWAGLGGGPGGWDVADLPLRAGPFRVAGERTIRHFHGLGMWVMAWTVDDEADMKALLAAGVDGIMTDRPDLLARLRACGPAA